MLRLDFLKITILSLFFTTNLFTMVYAENNIHPDLLSLKSIQSLTSEAAKDTSYPAGLNDNKFFPIGFSQNGLFAYILDYSDGGCGHCPYLVVSDIVSDKQVVKQFFEGKIDTTQAYQLLLDWGIQDSAKIKLLRFPNFVDNDEYNVHVEKNKLILISKLKGQKQVSNLDSLQAGLRRLKENDLLIEGFLISPFENRIVIILSGLYWGFEGEVDLLYFTVGAHLEKGFKLKRPEFFTDEWPFGSPTSYVKRKELIDNGTLHDGMTIEEVHAILGTHTEKRDNYLEWYHNPLNRQHVAAFFRAELRDGKIYNWQTGNM